jgi:CheY-like chemotaxis protein
MAKHVLLVAEDNPDDALLLERALKRTGSCFQMVQVHSGEDVIAYLKGTGAFGDRRKHPTPKVVLLDLKMPRTDGFAVLEWRQAVEAAKNLPVVVFSSSSLRQDIQRAYALGANSYVVKPTAPERLERMVEALHAWWIDFNASTTAAAPA